MSETQQHFVLWEPEYNHRGTYSIFVTCFTTLGICLWSALHLSIPRRRRSWKGNLGAKLGWMIVGLFFPEYLIWFAADQRLQAAQLRNAVNGHFKLVPTRRTWYQRWFRWPSTVTEEKDEEQTLVRNPSDFYGEPSLFLSDAYRKSGELEKTQIVKEEPTMKPVLKFPFPRNKPGRHRWTLVHGFYAVMGGYATYDKDGELRILACSFIESLLRQKPDLIPDLSEHTILDKSKADGLAKALLFTQVGWFCVSCINRLAQGFPLTLLEVSTLAHAFCSMTAYIIWWDKPLNIQEPLIIYESSLLEEYNLPLRRGSWFDIERAEGLGGTGVSIIVFVISLVYGGPHLLGWGSTFATHTEQLLWRIASCVVVSSGVYSFVCLGLWGFIDTFISSGAAETFGWVIGSLSLLTYMSANLYLIAASSRQLFYLPSTAFQTPVWSSYFPHFS